MTDSERAAGGPVPSPANAPRSASLEGPVGERMATGPEAAGLRAVGGVGSGSAGPGSVRSGGSGNVRSGGSGPGSAGPGSVRSGSAGPEAAGPEAAGPGAAGAGGVGQVGFGPGGASTAAGGTTAGATAGGPAEATGEAATEGTGPIRAVQSRGPAGEISVEQAIALRDQAPEMYDLWLRIAQDKAATANYVERAPYEVPERLAQSGRPRALGALVIVLSFCGYLAWLGGPGPYIGGLIAILDLGVMFGMFFGLRPERLPDPSRLDRHDRRRLAPPAR